MVRLFEHRQPKAADKAKPLLGHQVPLWVPLGLAIGPLVALGLARFAYALLLPAMRADLN
jgi:hypothetical protein